MLDYSTLYILSCAVFSAYQQNDHPDEPTRHAHGAKISIEAKQVQYWFQN
jgi:hypothetical protein